MLIVKSFSLSILTSIAAFTFSYTPKHPAVMSIVYQEKLRVTDIYYELESTDGTRRTLETFGSKSVLEDEINKVQWDGTNKENTHYFNGFEIKIVKR